MPPLAVQNIVSIEDPTEESIDAVYRAERTPLLESDAYALEYPNPA
jgi:hypothetical protein